MFSGRGRPRPKHGRPRGLLFGKQWWYAGSDEQLRHIVGVYVADGAAEANATANAPELLAPDGDPVGWYKKDARRRAEAYALALARAQLRDPAFRARVLRDVPPGSPLAVALEAYMDAGADGRLLLPRDLVRDAAFRDAVLREAPPGTPLRVGLLALLAVGADERPPAEALSDPELRRTLVSEALLGVGPDERPFAAALLDPGLRRALTGEGLAGVAPPPPETVILGPLATAAAPAALSSTLDGAGGLGRG